MKGEKEEEDWEEEEEEEEEFPVRCSTFLDASQVCWGLRLSPLPPPFTLPSSRAAMCGIRCHRARGRQRLVQVEKHMAEIRNEKHVCLPGQEAGTGRLEPGELPS